MFAIFINDALSVIIPTHAPRWTLARKPVSDMASVVTRMAIASPRGAVPRVRTRSYAGKSSWKRAVFETEVEGATHWKDVLHAL